MNIEFGPELESFRQEVAAFLDTAPTPAIREAGKKTTSVFAPFEQAIAWQKILNAKGWAAPAWPKEYGGTGWSVNSVIFSRKSAAGANCRRCCRTASRWSARC
jgi:Acyl-CoA dehydrogenases